MAIEVGIGGVKLYSTFFFFPRLLTNKKHQFHNLLTVYIVELLIKKFLRLNKSLN